MTDYVTSSQDCNDQDGTAPTAPPRLPPANSEGYMPLATHPTASRLDSALQFCKKLELLRELRTADKGTLQDFFVTTEGVRVQQERKTRRKHVAQVNHNRRRARQKGAVGSFTREEWLALREQYQGRCAYCGLKTRKLTVDHVVALSRGGTNDISNIRPACGKCNSRKGAQPVEFFLVERRRQGHE